jgi:transcriptional regulator with XRE-family HTH domain
MGNFQLIKDLCEERHMSIRDLASRIEMRDKSLYDLIRHGSTNTTRLEAIAKELGVPAGIFFDGWPGDGGVKQSVRQSQNVKQVAQVGSKDMMEILREKDRQIAQLIELLEAEKNGKKEDKNKPKNKPSKTTKR